MEIWGYQLAFTVSFVFDGALVGLDGFVVEDFQIDCIFTVLEAHHDVIVSG